MAQFNSITTVALSRLKAQSTGRTSIPELVDWIYHHQPELVERWSPAQTWHYLSNRLQELAVLGVVEGAPEAGYQMHQEGPRSGAIAEISSVSPVPPGPPRIDSFGDGPEDEGNGIGVREVLIHPTLFSLNADEFDELLTSMLGDSDG